MTTFRTVLSLVALAGVSGLASAQYWERQGGVTFSTDFTDVAGVIEEGGDYFGPFTIGSPDPREELIAGNITGTAGGGHDYELIALGSWADIDFVINIAGPEAQYPATYSTQDYIYGMGDDLSQYRYQCDASYPECVVYLFGSGGTMDRQFDAPDGEFFYHAFETTDGRRGFLQLAYTSFTFENMYGDTVTSSGWERIGWAMWDAGATDPFVAFDVNEGLYCQTDFNFDGAVDLGDFGTFGAAFGSFQGDANYDPRADLDGDGDVDLGDFGIFGAEFGNAIGDCP